MNPFDFLNSINQKTTYLMEDEASEKAYPEFMVNRGLSYFNDTVLYANEMNINHHVDSKLAYDFLINSIRKRKRFSKWMKPEESDAIEVIKEYYGYSNEKARQALSLLSNEQIEYLKQKVSKGGRRK